MQLSGAMQLLQLPARSSSSDQQCSCAVGSDCWFGLLQGGGTSSPAFFPVVSVLPHSLPVSPVCNSLSLHSGSSLPSSASVWYIIGSLQGLRVFMDELLVGDVRLVMLVPQWFPKAHVTFDWQRLQGERVSIVFVLRGTMQVSSRNTFLCSTACSCSQAVLGTLSVT